MSRDQARAKRGHHLTVGLIALAADTLVVSACVRFAEKGVPDRNLVRFAQRGTQACIDDAEQTVQCIVAGPGEHLRHAAGKLVRDFAQRGEQQCFLAAEMEVDRRCGVTGGGRDPCRRERGKAESRNGESSRLDEIELRAGGPRLHDYFRR
jgi:hypothetical protein